MNGSNGIVPTVALATNNNGFAYPVYPMGGFGNGGFGGFGFGRQGDRRDPAAVFRYADSSGTVQMF